MNTKLITKVRLAALISALACTAVQAGDTFFDLDADPTVAAGFLITGNHPNFWYPSDGNPTSGGYLSIADGGIGGQGCVVVFPDIDTGYPIKAFHLTADVRAGNSSNSNGRPADGFSISYCREGDPVLVNATNNVAGGAAGGDDAATTTNPAGSGDLENGTKTGVAIIFDAWQGNMLPDTGAGGTPGPDVEGISIRADDKTLRQVDMQADRNGLCYSPTNADCAAAVCADPNTEQTGPWANDGGSYSSLCWARLDVELTATKQVTVIWKGRTLVDHFQLTNYPNHKGRLVLMGRTGGNNQNAHFDNIHLVTTPAIEAIFDHLSFGPALNQFTFVINDNAPSIMTNVSQVILDGANVTGSVTTSKNGTVNTSVYNQALSFAPGSTHTVNLTWQTSLGQTLSVSNQTFTVPAYATIPPSLAVTGVDTTQPGFQLLPWQSDTNPNRIYWTYEQLAGLHGANNADLTSATNNGFINYNGLINLDINGGNDGRFQSPAYPDAPFPGIPGANALTDNSALEVVSYVRFDHAGTYRMGVNSDDGFAVTVGRNPRDRLALNLGQFDGGRGASDTLFYFNVPAPGIYPMALMWENGGGGANLEWFTVDPTNGVKILVNDPSPTNNSGVTAFFSGPALPAFVSHINPYIGAQNVRPDTLLAQLTDAGTTVNGSSITMSVNGSSVPVTVSKVGNVTTASGAGGVHLMPSGNVTAQLAWTDSSGTRVTNSWAFTVEPYTTLDPSLSAPLASADLSKPGFVLHVAQVDPCLPAAINPSGPDDCGDGTENQIDSANAMLAGLYYPWYGTNAADVSTAETNNMWYWSNAVDFNVVTSVGDFGLNYPLPGIPSADGVASRPNDSFSASFDAYVAFPSAGFYQMGVSSDDGFRVTEGLGVTRQVLHVKGGSVDTDVAAVVSTFGNTGAPWNNTLPTTPLTAPVVYVGSAGCPNPTTVNLAGKIALIDQDRCTPGGTAPGGYNRLVYMCQTNGALACIVVAFPDWGTPERMSGGSLPITIPAVHVNGFNGQRDFWLTNGPLTATIGADTHLKLGEADYGKGMSHVDFGIMVPTPGVYPLHLVYEQAGGGAGLEWTTVGGGIAFDSSTRTLVNDNTAVGSLMAYRALSSPPRFISETVSGGVLTLKWIGTGTLQQSSTLAPGSWTDVSPQPSGDTYTTSANGPKLFFRLKQ